MYLAIITRDLEKLESLKDKSFTYSREGLMKYPSTPKRVIWGVITSLPNYPSTIKFPKVFRLQ
jgi:hypothetical protein